MRNITSDELKQIMPKCANPDGWVGSLNQAMAQFQIDSVDRVAAFLAQIAQESGQLNSLVENLNYSATRLMAVWPKRFTDSAKASQYENNPRKLANYVYALRLGNGDEASGDGWTYRGRGLIQVTGRGNYRSAGAALNLPLEAQPKLLEQPLPAALSAAFFWRSHGLNELADDRNTDQDIEDFTTITTRICGGKTGLTNRLAFWDTAKRVLAV